MRDAKDLLIPAQTITSGDVAGPAIMLGQAYGYAIAASWTGASLAGSVKLQASIDYNSITGAGTWFDISGSSHAVSGPGSFLWNVSEAFYGFVRPFFVYGSNSGAITYQVETKGP